MVSDAPTNLVTADELLRLSKDDFYGELIRGELVEEMPPGMRHEMIVAELIALLLAYVKANSLGSVLGGSGVWTERDPDTVRAPDVQFYDSDRLPLDANPPGYAEIAPNLAIEVRSPNDARRKLHD
jgi:Uma2 family endonuclease